MALILSVPKSGKFLPRIRCESSRFEGVNCSCLFGRNGLPEPGIENKQSTNSFMLFSCGCIKDRGFYKSFNTNNLKLKVMQRDENLNKAMEAETIQKNGAGLKSLMSRGYRFLVAATVVAIVFAACTENNVLDGSKMQNTTLQGIVCDVSGNPLSGVRVVTGSLSATTSGEGTFSFTQAEVVNSRAVIKFEKSGYYTLTRSRVNESDMFINAVLYPQGNSNISLQTSFDASSAKILEVSGMKVELPASSIMRADGSAYTGTVNANMLYLDPNNANFANMMPGGDLAAIRTDNSEVMLISWGMTNVNLTDNTGKSLQIKSGSTAELSFPIPAGMDNNPPATIPLWHFDEDKGIWIESGAATRQGNVYVGTVTHFSWVNLDVPATRVTIKGKVIDCKNAPVQFAGVKVEQVAWTYTNSIGEYSVFVPENTPVTVTVTANGGTDSKNIPGRPGSTTYNVEDFKLPCFDPNDIDARTTIEKATVEHVYRRVPNDGSNRETVIYTTFDNYGKRIRRDFLWIDNDRDPYVFYGNYNITAAHHYTRILNHIASTYYEWDMWWTCGAPESYWTGWTTDNIYGKYLNYDYGELGILYIGSSMYPLCIVSEAELVAEGFTKVDDKIIDSKPCKVYSGQRYGQESTYYIWNGLALRIEEKTIAYTYTDIWDFQGVSFDFPDEVFNAFVESHLCWPPRERLPENWLREMGSYCWPEE